MGDGMEQPIDHLLSGLPKVPSSSNTKKAIEASKILSGSETSHASSDTTLFSSSLPVLPHEKLVKTDTVDDRQSFLDKGNQDVALIDSIADAGIQVGSLLPGDEEELLAGIMDDFDLSGLPNKLEDFEDYDLFGSGGGLEIESDSRDNVNLAFSNISLAEGIHGNGIPGYTFPNGVGPVAGEHPFGEHPSRTLFVRNINSNVEDSELRTLFEQYGDIRTMYTTCKHRGFVMISYYDIRAARTAMRALQNKPLRRRKLDIHFSIPKDNPSDKDINQGTLVVFNLDPSVSNDDLCQIFGAYGEVKEIRETPHKRHHKFIEFFDVRAAEEALRSLNRSDIAGKRIKLEPSRPGGARRNLMLNLNQELEQDGSQTFRLQVASPIANSPPGNWMQLNSPVEHNSLHSVNRSGFGSPSPNTSSSLPGLASILHSQVSNSIKIKPIGKEPGRDHVEHMFAKTSAFQQSHSFNSIKIKPIGKEPGRDHVERMFAKTSAFQQSHSFPEQRLSLYDGNSFDASTSNGSGLGTLSGPQFLWGSPKVYSEPPKPPAWSGPSSVHQFTSNGHINGLRSGQHNSFLTSTTDAHHIQHHIGSAPSGVPLQRRFGFFQESPETSFASPAFRGVSLGHNDRSLMGNLSPHGPSGSGLCFSGNIPESGSPSFRMSSSPRINPLLSSNGAYPALSLTPTDNLSERAHYRRVENGNQIQIDGKKQFQLNLDKIFNGEDTRTTLMIKNIPNKYTSKMLLAAIDEYNKGTYDFLYLPIDFKNKCNVGYAFINMLSPKHIIPFYQAFIGKKWEKFNSEKVASLAYARIQGKMALVTHFQNSSLMNEDKRCRPILFDSESPESGNQELKDDIFECPSPQINGSSFRDSIGRLVEDSPVRRSEER